MKQVKLCFLFLTIFMFAQRARAEEVKYSFVSGIDITKLPRVELLKVGQNWELTLVAQVSTLYSVYQNIIQAPESLSLGLVPLPVERRNVIVNGPENEMAVLQKFQLILGLKKENKDLAVAGFTTGASFYVKAKLLLPQYKSNQKWMIRYSMVDGQNRDLEIFWSVKDSKWTLTYGPLLESEARKFLVIQSYAVSFLNDFSFSDVQLLKDHRHSLTIVAKGSYHPLHCPDGKTSELVTYHSLSAPYTQNTIHHLGVFQSKDGLLNPLGLGCKSDEGKAHEFSTTKAIPTYVRGFLNRENAPVGEVRSQVDLVSMNGSEKEITFQGYFFEEKNGKMEISGPYKQLARHPLQDL